MKLFLIGPNGFNYQHSILACLKSTQNIALFSRTIVDTENCSMLNDPHISQINDVKSM